MSGQRRALVVAIDRYVHPMLRGVNGQAVAAEGMSGTHEPGHACGGGCVPLRAPRGGLVWLTAVFSAVLLGLDGDALELSDASMADQEQPIGWFVSDATGEGEWWAASGKL
jgi:hypothetical protein